MAHGNKQTNIPGDRESRQRLVEQGGEHDHTFELRSAIENEGFGGSTLAMARGHHHRHTTSTAAPRTNHKGLETSRLLPPVAAIWVFAGCRLSASLPAWLLLRSGFFLDRRREKELTLVYTTSSANSHAKSVHCESDSPTDTGTCEQAKTGYKLEAQYFQRNHPNAHLPTRIHTVAMGVTGKWWDNTTSLCGLLLVVHSHSSAIDLPCVAY